VPDKSVIETGPSFLPVFGVIEVMLGERLFKAFTASAIPTPQLFSIKQLDPEGNALAVCKRL